MENPPVNPLTSNLEYLFLLSLRDSRCSIDMVYEAALYFYNPTGVSKKGHLPPRPKIIQDFISAYVKNPNSEESSILSIQVRRHMIDDFSSRYPNKSLRAFIEYAENRKRELAQRADQALEKAFRILSEAAVD